MIWSVIIGVIKKKGESDLFNFDPFPLTNPIRRRIVQLPINLTHNKFV